MRYLIYLALIIYSGFTAFLIYIFSVSDYEWMVELNDVASLCELPEEPKSHVIALLLLILVALLLIFSFWVKFKSVLISGRLLACILFLFWLWRFYLRFWLCS